MNPALGWDVVADVDQLLAFPFMVHALEAGTIVAVLAGVVGWFMVVRRLTFAGHTLSLLAFPGAAGALVLGAPAVAGSYAACALGGAALARVTHGAARSHASESAAIGSLQALALGLGFVFVHLYHGALGGVDALLFGTFLGVSQQQVVVLAAVALASVALVGVSARPLLFASVDPRVAGARGVPVAALSAAFLLVLGLAVAATSQITGALLVFALLVMPAATAQELTVRPALSLALTIAIALAVTWLGLAIAYYSIYPVGFYVTSLAFGLYVAARVLGSLRREALPA